MCMKKKRSVAQATLLFVVKNTYAGLLAVRALVF